MKQQIREAIQRALIKEAEKKSENKNRKCNKLINKIKGDIDTLSEMLEDMGIDTDSKPYKQLQKMYSIMTGFDPIQTKLSEYFNMPSENSAMGMVNEEGDVKLDSSADRESEDKAVDMARKYNMDIELTSKRDEQTNA